MGALVQGMVTSPWRWRH